MVATFVGAPSPCARQIRENNHQESALACFQQLVHPFQGADETSANDQAVRKAIFRKLSTLSVKGINNFPAILMQGEAMECRHAADRGHKRFAEERCYV
jgi:hypothetical protein